MLFTKSTESGIQLENALILSPEQYKKAQIPANNKRILQWAKDNHVNISLNVQKDSDFNCTLGIMMDSCVSDSTMSTNKKILKRSGEELTKFIDDMSDEVDEANKDAETREKLRVLVDKFKHNVMDLCGEDTLVDVKVFKLREVDAESFMAMLNKALGVS